MDPAVLAALQQMGLPAPPVPQAPGAPPAPIANPVVPVPPPPPQPGQPPLPPQGPLAPAAPAPEMPAPAPPGGPVMPPPSPGPMGGMAPPTFAPPMPGGPGMGGIPAPVQGGPPTPGAPGAPGAPPGPPPEDPQVEAEAELARQDSAEDDTLGTGSRPRRGHSMQHPLDMASAQIGSELRANAPRLAADLFPNGPAGSIRPAKEALNAYVRRHWDDPDFRTVMLNRMAPKGPDGSRVPWGVKNYLKLYEEAIAPYRLPNRIDAPTLQGGEGGATGQPPFQPPGMPPPGEDAGLPPPPGLNQLGV